MTMTRKDFEKEFHSRTLAYLPDFRDEGRPVVILVGPDAHHPNGHALLTTLVNQLARAHRRIVVVGDLAGPLRCRDVFGFGTLERATVGLARAINPFIEIVVSSAVPEDALIVLGVGSGDAEVPLGCDGWCAVIGPAAEIDRRAQGLWGALFAACLGAAVAFHRQRGVRSDGSGRYSLWRLGTDDQGPPFAGPIDVGRVLQVGAGAVGIALDHFLALVGLEGAWRIVDGDVVDVTNLNRQMLFLAIDAGFPEGKAANKAERAAALLGRVATPSPVLYHTDEVARDNPYDLVLALANLDGVRAQLQQRQPTVLLHATTGPAWEVFLHRHIAGRDDCIVCRIDETAIPQFICAEGEVQGPTGVFDAALPFLSATAGLLLASALAKLHLGVLAGGDGNFSRVNMAAPQPLFAVWSKECRPECHQRLPAARRALIDRDSRFLDLDPEAG
ncbi:MAG TPA: ThiF family adenylyltransferase [Vicinamibacterales bacterium]|nr:ThiF family adenylyltransferase [Vicinamibacterales bacterium]